MEFALQEEFRNYLIDNNFNIGDKLEKELDLAEHFKVSRGTMREVIMYFCHMGILERVKNKGTFIREISTEKLEKDIAFCFQLAGYGFEDLKETRLCVETALAPLIAKRITPGQIARLRENIETMGKLADQPEEADKLDRDFHLLLLDSCNNPTMKMFTNIIYGLFRKEFRGNFLNPDAVRKSVRDHRIIVDSLASEDAEGARCVLVDHIVGT